MSTLALALIILGTLVILTRAPLIFAPHETRAFYLGLFETETKMRRLAAFIAVVGAFLFWAGITSTGLAATVLLYVGAFMLVVAIGGMMIFPGAVRGLATKTWGAFSNTVLRVIGVVAVIFGAAIVYYGLTL